MSNEFDEYVHEDQPAKWKEPASWTALLLVGWLIYEFTAQPGLAAFAVCTKLTWNDFATARWLSRVDYNWRRARMCFWFYLAFGLWKMAVAGGALIALTLIGILIPQQLAGPQRAELLFKAPSWRARLRQLNG